MIKSEQKKRADLSADGFMSIKEFAAYLSVSPTAVKEMVRQKRIAHIREGRRVCISRVAAREFAANRMEGVR